MILLRIFCHSDIFSETHCIRHVVYKKGLQLKNSANAVSVQYYNKMLQF